MGGRGSHSSIASRSRTAAPTPTGPSSVADCQTFQETQTYMQGKYNILVDGTLADADFETLKAELQSVDDILSEFPQAAQGMYNRHVTADVKRNRAYASASLDGSLNLNLDKFRNDRVVEERYKSDLAAKYHPEGTTVKDILAHEMGHQLERILLERNVQYSSFDAYSRFALVDGWNKSRQATRIISEACKAAKRTPEGKGKKNNELVAEISRYATVNRSEALAECVADYHANREKAKPLSREVWKILKSELG